MTAAATDRPDLQSLWDYDDPAASEDRFRALLPAAEAAGDDGFLAEVLSQIARSQGLQGQFDDAHDTLDRAEARLDDDLPRAAVRAALERGRLLNSSGQQDDARGYFHEAWDGAGEAGFDGLAVDAAHMLALVEPPEAALLWNETALAIAQRSDEPDAQRWVGSLHNNIGWTLHTAGDFTGAMAQFEAQLAFRRKHGTPSELRVARWCVARCARSLGRLDDALVVQRELAAEITADGGGDGYVDEELGECLLALGKPEEARPHFARAHERLSALTWLAEAEPERIERLRGLSEA